MSLCKSLKLNKRWCIFLFFILTFGILFRVMWSQDIEWKADEQCSYAKVQNVGVTEPWSWVGMPSSASLIPNPGMSIWIFIVLGKAFHVTSPIDLAHVVQALNIAALLILFFFAIYGVPSDQKKVWLWALAFAAVNPLAVIFQRKIWSQSILPIFSILFLISWWRREKKWSGSFLWGFLGAILGQIHMSGFFFSASIFLWTVLFENQIKNPPSRGTRWKFWCLGSVLGALPLIPWLYHLIGFTRGGSSAFSWKHIFRFDFYNFWFVDALGFYTKPFLGKDFYDFLRYPLIESFPTYLTALVHFLLVCVGFYSILLLFKFLKEKKTWKDIFVNNASQTTFLQSATLWGMGGLLTLFALSMNHHYLIVTFPIQYIWLTRTINLDCKRAAWILGLVWIGQVLISINFLNYIHIHHGAPNGDYGKAYSILFQ